MRAKSGKELAVEVEVKWETDDRRENMYREKNLGAIRIDISHLYTRKAQRDRLLKKGIVTTKSDPVAEKLVAAMASLSKDKAFNLGRKGYVVKRAKGKGAKGFVAEKVG